MPVFLGCVIIFLIWFSYERRKTDKLSKRKTDGFWEQERLANSVRRQDISDLDYLVISENRLPFKETDDPELIDIYERVKALLDKKIINLSEYTNTELKLKYGSANLNVLSEYDENFTRLMTLMNKWGTRLVKLGDTDAAIEVLSYAVECGSDSRNTFVALGKLYSDCGASILTEDLIKRAENLKTPMKTSIISELETLL